MLKKFGLFVMLFSLSYSAPIEYINVDLSAQLTSYSTNNCQDLDTTVELRADNSKLSSSYIPVFYAIKENVRTNTFQNQLGETCKNVTYDAQALKPQEYVSDLYARYNTQIETISTLSGEITANKTDKTDKELEYNQLLAITEQLALDWQKIQEDFTVLEDEVKIYRVERDNLLTQKAELELNLDLNSGLISERDALAETQVNTKQLLEEKILELEATKTQYSSYESDIDINTLLDDGLNTGTYNLVDALNDYINAHQNDIRTSRTVDNTLMDLNYMQMNFLQTGRLR